MDIDEPLDCWLDEDCCAAARLADALAAATRAVSALEALAAETLAAFAADTLFAAASDDELADALARDSLIDLTLDALAASFALRELLAECFFAMLEDLALLELESFDFELFWPHAESTSAIDAVIKTDMDFFISVPPITQLLPSSVFGLVVTQ